MVGFGTVDIASLIKAIDSITNMLTPIGWAVAGLSILLWEVNKLLALAFPGFANQYEGTVSKVAMGALALGIAPTILTIVQTAVGV